MITIESTEPCPVPPDWAIWERKLFDLMDRAVEPFVEQYLRPDGRVRWPDGEAGRVRSDAFYEGLYNWPLLYVLGGGDHFLTLARRSWEGITSQLTGYGLLHDEYERGMDWFHQSEGNLLFYYLCLADPADHALIERSARFADYYLGEHPTAANYDATRRVIRAPRTGSMGPQWGVFDGEANYPWRATMARYGLPFDDVPGVACYDDLRDPDNARRMGAAMDERMGRGDVAQNLAATTLITTAYLLTGQERFRRWVIDYVEVWQSRAALNGGLLPDNVGLSGEVGEYTGGKWYGGYYGWTWPHGLYSIAAAATVAGANAYLLTGCADYLDLPRQQLDPVYARGETRAVGQLPLTIFGPWPERWLAPENTETFVVPYRHGDGGWFDYQPPTLDCPTTLWSLSQAPLDWARLESLRERAGYDWRQVPSFKTKEENGHEAPWLRFLAGDNPTYPEQSLRATYAQVVWHLDLIRADTIDPADGEADKHHLSGYNPVFTEALVQLTLGAPQVIYNSGLLLAPIRYYDSQRQRPGLPPGIAALVSKRSADALTLQLVNTDPFEARDVVIRAGVFGEHQFSGVRYTAVDEATSYPGQTGYGADAGTLPRVTTVEREQPLDAAAFAVRLHAASQITLTLTMRRFVNQPGGAFDGYGADAAAKDE
jgi:hypothetical protein